MDRRTLAAFLLGLGILMACNDHDPHPPNVTDPGTNQGGAGGGGGGSSGTTTDGGGVVTEAGTDAGGACSTLEDPTTSVDENAISDVSPGGLGGVPITDGTYDLTIVQKYVGAAGQPGQNGVTYREVIRISSGTSLERNRTTQEAGGPEVPLNATYVFQVSGTNLLITQQCPAVGTTETFPFTFQNGRLTLTSTAGESFTYIIRP